MPPRKKTTEDTNTEPEAGSDEMMSDSSNEPAKFDNNNLNSEASVSSEETSGQLFFSTDGSEPAKDDENPYLDGNDQSNAGEQPLERTDDSLSGNAEGSVKDESKVQETPRNHSNSKPHRGPHPNHQKKQTWQEKKKQRNKQRQKFKKPKRLPYEETEAKPLELGELLENESLKTEEGISALAEDFNSSDQKPIELDELLLLSLQELKEKVTEYDLNLGQAPLREEIFDSLLEKCLETKIPVIVSGIIQVMEDGHAFLLQQREDYRLKSK